MTILRCLLAVFIPNDLRHFHIPLHPSCSSIESGLGLPHQEWSHCLRIGCLPTRRPAPFRHLGFLGRLLRTSRKTTLRVVTRLERLFAFNQTVRQVKRALHEAPLAVSLGRPQPASQPASQPDRQTDRRLQLHLPRGAIYILDVWCCS